MNDSAQRPRARFRRMDEAAPRDWEIIQREMRPYRAGLADRILDHLRLLGGDYGGFAIDRLAHSLQTATRAHQDGRDEEYVVCALLHDVGDSLASYNHADVAAAIVKPFVAEKNHWLVQKHALFQGYHFFHHVGLDRDLRERYRGHPHFDYTAEFIDRYDQASFEAGFASMPLADFVPMVRRVFAKPRDDAYMIVE